MGSARQRAPSHYMTVDDVVDQIVDLGRGVTGSMRQEGGVNGNLSNRGGGWAGWAA